MSQARENLTALAGTIGARKSHPALSGYDEINLEVAASHPVQGVADLLAPNPGDHLTVAVRHDLVADAPPGAHVRFRASRGSSGYIVAEPHPAPGDFELTS